MLLRLAHWNNGANWANNTALPTIDNFEFNAAAPTGLSNIRTLNIAGAFNGDRLCENTVGLLEEDGLSSWTDPGAVDVSEWVNQIRTVSTIGSDYYIQESLHPDYRGRLALCDCLRQAYDNDAVRSGNLHHRRHRTGRARRTGHVPPLGTRLRRATPKH